MISVNVLRLLTFRRLALEQRLAAAALATAPFFEGFYLPVAPVFER